MNAITFKRLLVRHMCDDLPAFDDITISERKDREHLLDCVAVQKGFTDWLDAYHRFDPSESDADRLLRIAFVPERT